MNTRMNTRTKYNLLTFSGCISNIFTQKFGLLLVAVQMAVRFWRDITEKVQQDEVAKQQQLLLRYDMLGIY